jgi:hypothetical protein
MKLIGMLLIALFVTTAAQAKKSTPTTPTEVHMRWADLVLKDPAATEADKKKAKLIIDRVGASFEVVCDLPEEPTELAQCAIAGDFTSADRKACVNKVLDGAGARLGREMITLITSAYKIEAEQKFGVSKLPIKPANPADCLVGSTEDFDEDARKICCNTLSGAWSDTCVNAAKLKADAEEFLAECL